MKKFFSQKKVSNVQFPPCLDIKEPQKEGLLRSHREDWKICMTTQIGLENINTPLFCFLISDYHGLIKQESNKCRSCSSSKCQSYPIQ